MSNTTQLATPPVAAEHGDRCACRHCASQAYSSLQQRADYLQQQVSRLAKELAAARRAAVLADARRLTVEIRHAIERKDGAVWARLVAQRAQLPISADDLIAIQEAA
jgi:hypothetical protein